MGHGDERLPVVLWPAATVARLGFEPTQPRYPKGAPMTPPVVSSPFRMRCEKHIELDRTVVEYDADSMDDGTCWLCLCTDQIRDYETFMHRVYELVGRLYVDGPEGGTAFADQLSQAISDIGWDFDEPDEKAVALMDADAKAVKPRRRRGTK